MSGFTPKASPELRRALHTQMLEDLRRSGLNAADAERMRLTPMPAVEFEACFKQTPVNAYRIPYFDFSGKTTGYIRGRKLELIKEDEPRYTQQENSGVHLYLPPFVNWRKVLKDPSMPVFVVEGEKKAARGCTAGAYVVGLGGVDSFGGKLPTHLLPDLIELSEGGRDLIIVFDWPDTLKKPEVIDARTRFANHLALAGATPWIVDIEVNWQADGKVGLDDLLQHRKDDQAVMRELLERKRRIAVTAADLYAYLPQHKYLYLPTRELWPAESVDIKIKMTGEKWASDWLDKHRCVQQMSWAPGEPQIIRGKLITEGGWHEHPEASVFNLYKPPTLESGDPRKAKRWLDHIKRIYPLDWRHIVYWLAHRAQFPADKVNHGLVLGGAQGIGKDSALEPVVQTIGPWNVCEITPKQLAPSERFNGFAKSVILRINETHDLGEQSRYDFYEATKMYMAAPPFVIRCNEKHLREHFVPNLCGVILTTNHKRGLFLPVDDRRHSVAWSEATKEEFTAEEYWKPLWHWYQHEGGFSHVAAYLRTLNLEAFDAKAPPPKTAAWYEIVSSNRAPEDAELADAFDRLNEVQKTSDLPVPVPAVTLDDVLVFASEELKQTLKDPKNRRQVPHRMDSAGYAIVRNEADKHDGQWKIRGKRRTVYALRDLSIREQKAAATALVRTGNARTIANDQIKRMESCPERPERVLAAVNGAGR